MDPWREGADRQAFMPSMPMEQWLEEIPTTIPEDMSPWTESRSVTATRRQRSVAIRDLHDACMAKRNTALEYWRKQSAQGHAQADRLAQTAFHQLLLAGACRLGCRSPDGWTYYDKKTSMSACLDLRELLQKGDPETGLKPEEFSRRAEWENKVNTTRWWFETCSDAIDFLSFLGRGPKRFGSEIVRIDTAQYNHAVTRRCISAAHKEAMAAFYFFYARPYASETFENESDNKDVICACADQARLVKLIAERQGTRHTESRNVQEAYAKEMREQWFKVNQAAGKEMKKGEVGETLPLVVDAGGVEVKLWWRVEDLAEEGVKGVGFRVEGAIGELL